MKYLFLYFLTLACNAAFSQTDTLYLYQAYTSFSNQEKAEWTSFENNWQFSEYPDLKKKAGIKTLNCKNCESFYADIYMEINETGKIVKAIYMGGKLCGIPITEPLHKTWFENAVLKSKFQSIKNKKFIARFGNILKC